MLFSIQLLLTFLTTFFALVHSTPTPHRGSKVKGLGVPVRNSEATNVIANRYIVVYNGNATDDAIDAHQASVMSALKKRNLSARGPNGKTLSTKVDTVKMSGWRCMALEAEGSTMLEIASASEVAYIEADTIVKAAALVEQTVAPTGLKRISHAAAGGAGYVFDDSAGTGITAFVVDTGIRTTHSEFGGRATFGANMVNNVNTDENGHGSHVAGTIGGTTFGVAKNVNLVAVKVLDGNGAGSNSGVISGIQFVAQNATPGKSVMNMSLGGAKSNALNSAIAALTRAGVTVVVAAGNENQDALNTSPGSAPTAITVGAIDGNDARASFSNFGTAVDIFAPGVKVQSVGIATDTSTAVLSGTSMASPHVAGLAAYLMSLNGLTAPADVTAKMLQLAGATGAAVTGAGTGTTTLIANNGSGQ